MKKNTIKTVLLLTTLVGTLSIGGIMAYFTDADMATNTFTIGKISLDLQEPNWTPPKNITPGQEIKKDPQIKNDGVNDEYVFLKVMIPYEKIVTANEDGSKNSLKATELFTYDVKDGWMELISEKEVSENSQMITHIYAYTGKNAENMQALKVGETTNALFEWVRFANIVEDQTLESTTRNIVIQAYGIQTDNINDGKEALDGDNTDGTTAPLDVWKVLKKQNPSFITTSQEETYTDIKK